MSNIFPEKKLGFGLMRMPLLNEKDKKAIKRRQKAAHKMARKARKYKI